eukprot:1582345-Rhodomonas_salina.1
MMGSRRRRRQGVREGEGRRGGGQDGERGGLDEDGYDGYDGDESWVRFKRDAFQRRCFPKETCRTGVWRGQ